MKRVVIVFVAAVALSGCAGMTPDQKTQLVNTVATVALTLLQQAAKQ